ncbi:protein-L-isoaspartate O-methyltransferase [Bacillus sp. M6-12]|uniref:erythromycin esterase family protein n=1 Tax=Bacillus sp. M6-12 TaxID=2054166 RepID=UPI000C76E4F2|nr:erythromycin esterase family protein [Bacillus sp. M6-12]PLS17166.1 protein-L-isoaspartate O-methyltransferase [Bacillus sp. M6-12]
MLKQLADNIKEYAVPLSGTADLDVLVEKIGNAKIVLLGESSHGTSEFYQVRAELSKKLIKEKGFSFIAVEGDWPASQQVNRYVKGYDHKFTNAEDALRSFQRWPSWMWANREMIGLIEWMKTYNESGSAKAKAGFYGIDVYSLWESMEEVIRYLEKINSPDLQTARNAFSCFEPFMRDPQKYAVSSGIYSEGCIDEVTALLTQIRTNESLYPKTDEVSLNLKVNSLVSANAEKYYSTMVLNDAMSWNVRDLHMVAALNEVMDFYGSDAKAIVWEHNTHIGDARATDMAREGMLNVGQVVREQHNPGDVYAVGFGTYSGTVIAADEWGVNHDVKEVPPAILGSWEDVMYRTGAYDKMLFFDDNNRHHFSAEIGHRAIGVVYNPEYERFGNYVPSVMSERYDAFVFLDQTKALQPLQLQPFLV